jgi:hypothetical protein
MAYAGGGGPEEILSPGTQHSSNLLQVTPNVLLPHVLNEILRYNKVERGASEAQVPAVPLQVETGIRTAVALLMSQQDRDSGDV